MTTRGDLATDHDRVSRWDATLSYTTDDDGLWLILGDKRVNLGYDPTLREVFDGATQLEIQDAT